MKNTFLYEEVKDMTADALFAVIFLAIMMFGHLILAAIHYGAIDIIAIKLTNYIVSRMERNEKGI